METSNSQVLDIREQAKQKALKIISATPGAISFVNTQELETQSLFVPVVTILKASVDDFHNLKGGAKMPKSYYTNQIAEATGVNITDVRVQKTGEYIWQGHAEGDRRMPDGTMRHGSGEYEFDAEKRAEEDWLSKPDDYKSEISKRKHVLEYARFGMQRASSGARLALIRYLAGIPTGFNQDNIQKAMIFCRVDRNVDGILTDPQMREAIINHALGATEQVFGPKQIEAAPTPRTVDVQSGEVLPAAAQPKAGQAEIAFQDDIPWDEKPEDIARRKLESFLALEKRDARLSTSEGWKSASGLIREMLGNKEATLAAMNDLAKRVEAWLAKNGVKTEAA
jgi:hypothetical protein